MTRHELGTIIEKIGGLPAGPLRNIQEAFDDEQARHRQMRITVPHPTIGELPLAGLPVKYSHTKPSVRMPPPLLGQHTEEVLTSVLGYDAARIQQLREEGVVA
jgi:crotonobetainyl-CoA:carnitine CoA-transferase CaiB-like acyl-CoA transferase